MWFLVMLLAAVVLLIVWGSVSGVRARRRGHRLQGVDGRAVRDRRQLAESELDIRTNGRMRGLRDQPWNGPSF
jgi:hypothetical protein